MKKSKRMSCQAFTCLILHCCLSLDGNAQHKKLQCIDSLLVSWNKATLRSLKDHIRMAPDKRAKEAYRIVDVGYGDYLGGENTTVDHESMRYMFLQTLHEHLKSTGDNVYIIEANESGERTMIYNYVLFRDTSEHIINIVRFNLQKDNKWHWDAAGKREVDNLSEKWSRLDAAPLQGKTSGVNNDIVIVTKISDGKIGYSNFYLDFTLPAGCPIDSILIMSVKTRKLFKSER